MRLNPSDSPRSRLTSLALTVLAPMLLLGPFALLGCGGSAPAGTVSSTARQQLDFGVQMARRGLWSEALFRFEQARGLDGNNARVLNNMAVASEALGNFEQAQRHYQEALRLAPNDPEVKRNYVRFTEFYVAYRAVSEEEAAADAAREAEDRGSEGQR